MHLREGLTKENFWNEMDKEFPHAMNHFAKWIDEYKSITFWDILFCNQTYIKPQANFMKYHMLPYDMQVGIWIKFADDTLNELFEQPEYYYCGDLMEDIKTVFKEINDLEEIAE